MSDRTILEVEGDFLVVIPRGFDKLWCFRRKILVPLASITDIQVERNPSRVPIGLRAPGLDFLGKLCGTFILKKKKHFWNYAGTGDALSIDIDEGQHFRHMYLSVADSESSHRELIAAVASYRADKAT